MNDPSHSLHNNYNYSNLLHRNQDISNSHCPNIQGYHQHKDSGSSCHHSSHHYSGSHPYDWNGERQDLADVQQVRSTAACSTYTPRQQQEQSSPLPLPLQCPSTATMMTQSSTVPSTVVVTKKELPTFPHSHQTAAHSFHSRRYGNGSSKNSLQVSLENSSSGSSNDSNGSNRATTHHPSTVALPKTPPPSPSSTTTATAGRGPPPATATRPKDSMATPIGWGSDSVLESIESLAASEGIMPADDGVQRTKQEPSGKQTAKPRGFKLSYAGPEIGGKRIHPNSHEKGDSNDNGRKHETPESVVSTKAKGATKTKQELAAVLKSWLLNNWINPYPDDDEVADLAASCGTDSKVVRHWLINARTRKWRPALEKACAMRRPPELLLEDSINLFHKRPVRKLLESEDPPAPTTVTSATVKDQKKHVYCGDNDGNGQHYQFRQRRQSKRRRTS